MNSIILSTTYFPNIDYCGILKTSDKITIDLGEHFVKQTFRSRTEVLGANGKLKLVVPLIKWRNNTSVKDIKISYSENWQKIHWKTMESAYRSSPYFEYYEDKLKEIVLNQKFEFLKDLNKLTLDFTINELSLSPEIICSNDYIENAAKETDFRKIGQKRTFKNYHQVFNPSSFVENLSFIDLICNEGPNAIHLL